MQTSWQKETNVTSKMRDNPKSKTLQIADLLPWTPNCSGVLPAKAGKPLVVTANTWLKSAEKVEKIPMATTGIEGMRKMALAKNSSNCGIANFFNPKN